MGDYAKLKNVELEAMLKSRDLPHTGKKAEMVARLQQDDANKAASAASATTKQNSTNNSNLPVFKGNSHTTSQTVLSGAATVKSFTQTSSSSHTNSIKLAPEISKESECNETPDNSHPFTHGDTPENITHSAQVQNESSSSRETSATAAVTSAPAPAPDIKTVDVVTTTATTVTTCSTPSTSSIYSAGLSATDLDNELARRISRAKKFGLGDLGAQEAVKRLERAKKFGPQLDNGQISHSINHALDSALPDRIDRRRVNATSYSASSTTERSRFNIASKNLLHTYRRAAAHGINSNKSNTSSSLVKHSVGNANPRPIQRSRIDKNRLYSNFVRRS